MLYEFADTNFYLMVDVHSLELLGNNCNQQLHSKP